MIVTELDGVKGIGEKTKNILLKEYKSVKKIKDVSKENLIKLIGLSKTQLLLDHFKSK